MDKEPLKGLSQVLEIIFFISALALAVSFGVQLVDERNGELMRSPKCMGCHEEQKR